MSRSKTHKLMDLLKEDIARIQMQYNTKINMVCISGDLIDCGDKSIEELEIVLNEVINPLMCELNLEKEHFFVVPGNHEIKKSEIVEYIEKGLELTLKTEAEIEKFLSQKDTGSVKRINYFQDFSLKFGGVPIANNDFFKSYCLSINGITFGVVCVNSAWRSTGIGQAEKGKMIVGRKQIIDGFESIKTADIKICMMHHPLDWLVSEDEAAIEKCINQYDVVLNGHIHETSTQIYTSYNGQTIFNTCGKFDATSDIYNGYSVLSINPYNKDCNVILRQYFDFPRNCFDKAIGLHQDGVFEASIGKKDDILALAYNITNSISIKFSQYANSYFVSNVVSGKNLKNFDNSFIIPTFSKYSEYEKETSFDNDEIEKVVSLEQICNEHKNYLLLGKKEIGKTTTLHYIINYCISNFNMLHSVPILINCSLINCSGKDIIIRSASQYINNFCSDDDSFSLNDIKLLMENGLCTILFDNFESVDTKKLLKINEFLSLFPNNKFIFSEKESIGARSLRKIPIVPECDYEKFHICSLSKGQIRSATEQYMLQSEQEALSLVDKIMLCFKKTTLPKTPFVLSLILSLCNNLDFTPINEAVIMEQFMESLLEKTSPNEADSSKFDFRAKEDFLMFIVAFMNEHNQYYLTNEEFDKLLIDYHSYMGFAVTETFFDRLFFEKGVLVRTDYIITFRYTCIIEYYIAKKAGQEPEFLEQIMSDRNYLNYSNELIYYTGLNRKNNSILNKIEADLLTCHDALWEKINELEEYKIGLEVALPEETLKKKLVESRLTQEKSDALSDAADRSEEVLPENIDKKVWHDDMGAFIETLLIYGNCIKNLELISCEEKSRAYHYYLSGLCIMLLIWKENTETDFDNIIMEMENSPEKFNAEEINSAKSIFNDIIKISLPIVIQNIALENIGTAKLRSIFEEAIQKSQKNDFEKFFSVFIYSDLRLQNSKSVLSKYANEVENKSLLKIIFFKLLYYYQFRYFAPSLDSFLENILADINLKLQNKSKKYKSYLLKEIKGKERSFLD